jgi:N-acetylmuramoyl-L-alanine amidase
VSRRLLSGLYNWNLLHFVFNQCLLILLIAAPISCLAQKKVLKKNNSLKYISNSKRSDGKGYVFRFHLTQKLSSFNFSQPRPYLIQLELTGKNLNTSNVKLYDGFHIIKKIHYTSLKKGIGIVLQLNHKDFYKVAAYPDKDSKDLLIGLTRTTQQKLAKYIRTMKSLTWAAISGASNMVKTKDLPRAIDTTFQKIRNKLKFDTVVLDAGHGGFDTGAIGWHHTLEKNIVLAITKKVGYYINKYLPDVNVVYTRDSDKFVGLKERGRIANKANGDLFVCIHANASRSSRAHGTETFFLGLERSKTALKVMERENNVISAGKAHPKHISKQQMMIYELANSGNIANSQKLADMIQHQFKTRAKRKSRGVKQARFVVLYHASMPAVLVETGFITNPAECRFLRSKHGQSIVASAIFRAIRNYKEQYDRSMNFNASNE